MTFLDKLISFLNLNSITNNAPTEPTLYFQNGKLCRVHPQNYKDWYDVRYIVSDGIKYDLENTESIRNIKIPVFQRTDIFVGYGVTGSLDYILRMKAGNFYNRQAKELCSACLWKSTELMLANEYYGWSKKDFDRIVNWHNQLGMYEEAKKAKQYLLNSAIYTTNIFDKCAISIKNTVFSNAKNFKCDLVAFHDYGSGCCSECAKFRGRVYSISGKNHNFPKLPEYAKLHGNFHKGCRCTMDLFLDPNDKIYLKGKLVNSVKASTRPYKDDRTPREKELYSDYIKSIQLEEQKEADRNEYVELTKLLPDIAPKSFGAYRKMKNSKSANFMKLYDIAKENNIFIDLNE